MDGIFGHRYTTHRYLSRRTGRTGIGHDGTGDQSRRFHQFAHSVQHAIHVGLFLRRFGTDVFVKIQSLAARFDHDGPYRIQVVGQFRARQPLFVSVLQGLLEPFSRAVAEFP